MSVVATEVNVCLNQIMAEEAFDVMVVGSCMTDLVRWVT